jgi:hypothetical protein
MEDSRQAPSDQHHRVRCGRRHGGRDEFVRLALVPDAQRRMVLRCVLRYRQDLLPPAHHPVGFRKEAMSAEIHPIAAVFDGLGDSTYLDVCLEDGRYDGRAAQQLSCSRQACGPRSCHHGDLVHADGVMPFTIRQP